MSIVTEAEVYPVLSEIFSDIFLRDIPLSAATTAADVEGWDSFKQIEIIMALEERFNIKFHTREIDSLKCVGDLVGIVTKKAH